MLKQTLICNGFNGVQSRHIILLLYNNMHVIVTRRATIIRPYCSICVLVLDMIIILLLLLTLTIKM